jgi:8-oxo-dGTP diphosphatase
MIQLPMLTVVCAIIFKNDGRILITQRSARMKMPLKWEFPGGKVEKGEDGERAIIREIKEELDLDIKILKTHIPYEHNYPGFTLFMMPYEAEIIGGDLFLKEHRTYAWVRPNELPSFDFSEGDLEIVRRLTQI